MTKEREIGAFAFRGGVAGVEGHEPGESQGAPFVLDPESTQELSRLEQHLREARGWTQERLCKVLVRRYDPGWDRIESLKMLESLELNEDVSVWVIGLFFATLCEIDGLDDFYRELLVASQRSDEDGEEAQLDELSHEELMELAQYLTLHTLEAAGLRALLELLYARGVASLPEPEVEVEAPKKEYKPEARVIEADDEGPELKLSSARVGFEEEPTVSNLNVGFLSAEDTPTLSIRKESLSGPTDMAGSDLTGANFEGANLSGAQLQGAILRDANLKGADLSNADLTGANLRGADLTGANLENADLTGAVMREARLRDANLKGTKMR